jgi:hypothetical protein
MGTQPKKFAKPAVADVYGFLRRRDALIIHFSGPKGSEARQERMFPADLRNVIAGGAMGDRVAKKNYYVGQPSGSPAADAPARAPVVQKPNSGVGWQVFFESRGHSGNLGNAFE